MFNPITDMKRVQTGAIGCDKLATDIPKGSCSFRKPIWNQLGNLREDRCAQSIQEYESRGPGCYETWNFYRWSTSPEQYASYMQEPGHMQKVYGDACNIDSESDLKFAPLTNMRDIYQLYTNPYATVPYMGAGQGTFQVDLESELQQGQLTKSFAACNSISSQTQDRFSCLPNFGQPQRIEHIMFPGNATGLIVGLPTRDFVRAVNYNKYCQNQLNNALLFNNRTLPLPNPAIFSP